MKAKIIERLAVPGDRYVVDLFYYRFTYYAYGAKINPAAAAPTFHLIGFVVNDAQLKTFR